ncbi:MAG TPA: hypothetical protein VLX29_07685 [Nitrospirota bacterium]|nr:hypothetical protein [Nitrospirota bacterium]
MTVVAAVVIGLGIIGGGILANPHDLDLTGGVTLADLPAQPETVEVVADTLDVELHLVDDPMGAFASEGFLHGFGLPTNNIKAVWEFDALPVPVLRYRVTLEGWFTDIDGTARIRIPVRGLHRVTVRLKHGDIRVFYETHSATSRKTPMLDLQTKDGKLYYLFRGSAGPKRGSAFYFNVFNVASPNLLKSIIAVRRT